jgi:cyclic pyranopterin phosphate synthase
LGIGTQIYIGNSVVLEVTQIGKECHKPCAIYKKAGICVMPREGIFARVIRGGDVKASDAISVSDK